MGTRGKFIVFEGLDGSGKTTQADLLRARLSAVCDGKACIQTREPSDSAPGQLCQSANRKNIVLEPETLALMFAADRIEHITKELLPELNSGNHVICDRYYFSNFAYQTLSCELDSLLEYNSLPRKLLRPDIVLFIDVPPERCEERRNLRREPNELYEKLELQRKIRANYFAAFDKLKDSERIAIIDGDAPADVIAENVWSTLLRDTLSEDDFK